MNDEPSAIGRFDDAYGVTTSRFYDDAYGAMPGRGPDVDFYRELAGELGGPVLELGCGTGRVLLEIAKSGLPCSGVDLSQHMLSRLQDRNRAADTPVELELLQAPMQRFELGAARFKLIFSAFRAFQHLYDVEAQLSCLQCVRRHLAPGGVLAFDVFNPNYSRIGIAEEPETEDLRFSHEGEDIVRYAHVTRDTALQMLHVKMRYERWSQGSLVGNERSEFDMRWFHRYELEHLLARSGFDEIAIYGDFDRSAIQADSPAFVVVAS